MYTKTKFKEFFDSVNGTREHILAVDKELRQLTSRTTFSKWAKGEWEPGADQWAKINEVAQKFGYNKPYVL